jgi:hypothetical protein
MHGTDQKNFETIAAFSLTDPGTSVRIATAAASKASILSHLQFILPR